MATKQMSVTLVYFPQRNNLGVCSEQGREAQCFFKRYCDDFSSSSSSQSQYIMVDESMNVQFAISYCTGFPLLTHAGSRLQTDIIL